MSKKLLRFEGSRIVNNNNTHILTVYYPKQYEGNPDHATWQDFMNVSQDESREILQTMIAAYNACVTINADDPKQVAENLEHLVKAARRVSVAISISNPIGGAKNLYDVHDELVELEKIANHLHVSRTKFDSDHNEMPPRVPLPHPEH